MYAKEPEKDIFREEAARLIEDLTEIYEEKIVASPHRTVKLSGRKCSNPRINTTLLGYELQIGDKRFNCPDMTTALFLKIFALIGTGEVKVPLDPTRTAELLPCIEKRWDQFRDCCRKLESVNRKNLALNLHRRLKARILDAGRQSSA